MDAPPVIGTLAELLDQLPDLRGAWVTDVDLRATDVDWSTIDMTGAAFGGCQFADNVEQQLRGAGATVLPPIESIGCIDGALQRFIRTVGAPIVGVMGSHAVGRDDPNYREVAQLGRLLTRAGFVVATGGGPGLMEAANLGAWLAHAPDDALEAAIDMLTLAPRYEHDERAFLECALAVRAQWPDGTMSLGVPTWLYVDEPLNQFSAEIAKYFQNSIRENGLLAIALGGVVFAPGGSGTSQEIFTDAAQNDYTLYGVRSPMVLMGADHYSHEPQLVAALRSTAEHGGWAHLVRVVDGAAAATAAIQELVPPDVVAPQLPLRKR